MAYIKSNMTYTLLGKTFCDECPLPNNGDVIFWRDSKKDYQKFSGVCTGRIFDYSSGNTVSILVNHETVTLVE